MAPDPDIYQRAAGMIGEIEAEMRRIGYWSDEPLPDEAYHFNRAFGMDTMAFDQWLQFIFVPRVHDIIRTRGQFPPKSMVATQAIREFDTDPKAAALVSLLSEFDSLFG